MAVKRSYYEPYARYLSDNGFRVITFDYRGIGGSRPGSLRKLKTTMRGWGENDLAAAIDWASTRYPEAKLAIVGHSAGGQLLGLAHNNDRVSALLAVAAQSGYWGHWDPPRKYLLGFLWYVLIPTLANALSFFPAKAIGLGENMPAGVALEWARWARHPDYIVDPEGRPLRDGFARFRAPIRAYSFTDDGYAPRRAVEALLGFYVNSQKEHRHVAPAELGERTIGHFGFFRERFRDSLWRESADWLKKQG